MVLLIGQRLGKTLYPKHIEVRAITVSDSSLCQRGTEPRVHRAFYLSRLASEKTRLDFIHQSRTTIFDTQKINTNTIQ